MKTRMPLFCSHTSPLVVEHCRECVARLLKIANAADAYRASVIANSRDQEERARWLDGLLGSEPYHGATLGRRKPAEVIAFRTFAENEAEFVRRWAAEYAEWKAIGEELLAKASPGAIVVVAEITQEQRRRMAERGETSVLDSAFAKHAMGLR